MSSSPLLCLPVELHLEIIGMMDIRSQVKLAVTNRYFRAITPPPSHADLFVAEESQWARNKCLLACKACVRLRHFDCFAQDMSKGKMIRGSTEALSRFCLSCGVDRKLYLPGTLLTIHNVLHVLCSRCGHLSRERGRPGLCASCSLPATGWFRRIFRDQTRPDNDYEWTLNEKGSHADTHDQEFIYGAMDKFDRLHL